MSGKSRCLIVYHSIMFRESYACPVQFGASLLMFCAAPAATACFWRI